MYMKEKIEVHETILQMQQTERPRERLLACGPGQLSDHELLTVLIGSGTRERNVRALAAELLDLLDRKNVQVALEELQTVKGMGAARAAQMLAGMEFFRRRFAPAERKIGVPADVLKVVSHFADRRQEHFLCLSLNGAHEVMVTRVVSVGLVNRTIVHPREVFADPLVDRAAAIVVAHNHPSGNVEPSLEDREVTRRLRDAGETLGVNLLDHVIFSSTTYYSFLEQGEL
jgi:DNA repair protein RadC